MVVMMLGYCLCGLCAFPSMVTIVNIMRKWGKKKQEKKERHDVELLIMLRYSLHGLCAFPNMVSNAKIMRKWGKNWGKKERHDVESLIMLRYSLQGLSTFPNMVIDKCMQGWWGHRLAIHTSMKQSGRGGWGCLWLFGLCLQRGSYITDIYLMAIAWLKCNLGHEWMGSSVVMRYET